VVHRAVITLPQQENENMTERRRRGGGGRAARQAARSGAGSASQAPYVTRQVPCYEPLSEEALSTIEANADTVLEAIGIDFRDDPEALQLWRDAGAEVDGERVRMPGGLARKLIQDNAPSEFTQHARNSDRSVQIGGNNTVFVPGYGSPFVRDLENGRRYGQLEDFQNLVKLAYMSPSLHHSGGTICEPVDLPVNKRHLDMVYSHLKYSDKCFMGSVTHPDRAQDTVEMAKLVFGEAFVANNCCIASLINANSPMTFDDTMLGAAKVYARNNQACIISPFILAGAMSPVTIAATLTQILAEAMAGMAFTQLVNPGAPVVFGTFASSMSMQSGAPTFGTPEPALILYGAANLARRLGVPFRSGGSLTASKIPDAQAATESTNTIYTTGLAGVNFALHSAGWVEGGLAMSYEKFMLDADQLGMVQTFLNGVDMSANGQGMDALRETGPGQHFLGSAHTQANFETAFYRSTVADNNSYEQWESEGSADSAQRANKLWKKKLAEYEAPDLDPAIDEALQDFTHRKKQAFPDSNV